jgi:hypothetical protein
MLQLRELFQTSICHESNETVPSQFHQPFTLKYYLFIRLAPYHPAFRLRVVVSLDTRRVHWIMIARQNCCSCESEGETKHAPLFCIQYCAPIHSTPHPALPHSHILLPALSPSFYIISHLILHLTIASTTFATASSKWCKVRCSRDGGDRQLRTRLSGAQGCGFDSSFSLSFSLPCQSFPIISLYCIFLSSFLPVTFLLLFFLISTSYICIFSTSDEFSEVLDCKAFTCYNFTSLLPINSSIGYAHFCTHPDSSTSCANGRLTGLKSNIDLISTRN